MLWESRSGIDPTEGSCRQSDRYKRSAIRVGMKNESISGFESSSAFVQASG